MTIYGFNDSVPVFDKQSTTVCQNCQWTESVLAYFEANFRHVSVIERVWYLKKNAFLIINVDLKLRTACGNNNTKHTYKK